MKRFNLKYIVFVILALSVTQGATAQDFYLHQNGVTVVCDEAEIGDSGEVNGITYTKRTRDEITTENASTRTSSSSF